VIRRLLFDHFWWKLLSLVLAVMLWVNFVGEPELVTSQGVPILYRNLPNDLQIVADLPERVQLELRGPTSRLTAANLAKAAAILDLSDVGKPGERTFTLSSQNVQLPDGVVFLRAVPSQLRLRFDRLAAKDVPVIVRVEQQPPAGYRLVRYEVEPRVMRVAGPEQRVNQITGAQTDALDLSTVIAQSEFRVHTFLADPQVRLESEPMVRVRVWVEKTP